jgi:hypothetical protein
MTGMLEYRVTIMAHDGEVLRAMRRPRLAKEDGLGEKRTCLFLRFGIYTLWKGAGDLNMLAKPNMQEIWERAERNLDQAHEQLKQADTEEEFQAVGLLCREAMITLAQAVFDPNLHTASDNISPSHTDAKRMLEAYLQHELEDSSYAATRKFARSALDLANDLQHKRTATFRDAALCVEATTAVVRVIALISGHLQGKPLQDIYRKIQSLMPELIAEMSADLKAHPIAREFFIVSKKWVMSLQSFFLIYYFEDHENLESKVQILENYGFVIDVTTGNAKKYRLMEEFVEFLLGSG